MSIKMNDCSFIEKTAHTAYIESRNARGNGQAVENVDGRAMNRGSSEAAGGKRTASKKARQQQLIRATIRSIAKNGLSATTMAAVSQEAGLSQGIVNLHFQSKDRLLVETLSFVVNEYRAAWEAALNETRGSSADKIRALVAVDFSAAIASCVLHRTRYTGT
jgi:TetR/AcrR family transcriptional repressor of bet genes